MTFVDQPSTIDAVRRGFIEDVTSLRGALREISIRESWRPEAAETLSGFGERLLALPIKFGSDTSEIVRSLMRPHHPAVEIAESLGSVLHSLCTAVRFDAGFGDDALSQAAVIVGDLKKFAAASILLPDAAKFPGDRSLVLEGLASRAEAGAARMRAETLIGRLAAPSKEEPETLDILILLAEQRLHEGIRYFSPPAQEAVREALSAIASDQGLPAETRRLAESALEAG